MLYFYIYIININFLFHPFSTQRGVAEFWTVTVTCHQVSKETEGFSFWPFVGSAEKFGVFKSKAQLCTQKQNDKLMVHVNETIVIKSDSPKVAEWVKRMKAYKAEQLERMRNSDKCDFEFQF